MKKTQIKDAFRTIGKQKVSFISIILIAFMSVTCFTGISFASKALADRGTEYYDQQNYRDIEAVSSIMFTEEDLVEIAGMEGIKDVEGQMRTAGKILGKSGAVSVSVQSLPKRINLPQLVEGRLPEKENEILLEPDLMTSLGVKVGDTVSVEDAGQFKLLKEENFTVVGTAFLPDHVVRRSTFGVTALIPECAFDDKELDGRKVYAEIILDKPEGIGRFSEEYYRLVEKFNRPLEELSVASARKNLIDFWDKLTAGITQFRESAFDPVARMLIMAFKGCSEEEANKVLERITAATASTIPDLAARSIDARSIEFLKGVTITLPEKEDLVSSLVDQLVAQADMLKVYGIDLTGFKPSEEEIRKAQDFVNKMDLKYYDKLLACAKIWNLGRDRYIETLEHLNGQRSSLEYDAVWMLLDVRMNPGYMHMEMNITGIRVISIRFTLLFIVIAAIVIYATVGKLVDEQRKLVGTTKAFGFRNSEIFGKYMIFGGVATVLGTGLGLLGGIQVLQRFLTYAYGRNYVSGVPSVAVIPWQVAVVSGANILLAVAAVLFASFKLLRSSAVTLMAGGDTAGLKKTKKSRKSALSLYQRLIFRNMRTDAKRILVTIVSVGGCCALILTGFSTYLSIRNTLDLQYDELTTFNSTVNIDPNAKEEDIASIESAIKEAGGESVRVRIISGAFKTLNATDPAEYIIGDLRQISAYFPLKGVFDGPDGELPDTSSGVMLPHSYARTYNLSPGDNCVLMDPAGGAHNAKIAGIFENYLGQSILMSEECYKHVFAEAKVRSNALLVRHPGVSLEDMENRLGKMEGFEKLTRSDELRVLFNGFTDLLIIMISILVVAAGLMSAVILTNLVNICILQKKRELTIMRVNGFTTKEVKNYITREAIITSAAGVLLGTFVGILLFRTLMPALGKSYTLFIMTPNPLAILIAAAITIFFTIVIYRIALRKIKDLKLSDVA